MRSMKERFEEKKENQKSRGATIEKIGDHPTTPDLLLSMVRSNFDDLESVVVSIINDGSQYTYWSAMKSAQLAYHMYGMQTDLCDELSGDKECK